MFAMSNDRKTQPSSIICARLRAVNSFTASCSETGTTLKQSVKDSDDFAGLTGLAGLVGLVESGGK
jgi:hypothetical protein